MQTAIQTDSFRVQDYLAAEIGRDVRHEHPGGLVAKAELSLVALKLSLPLSAVYEGV